MIFWQYKKQQNKFIQQLVQCSIHYSCFVECLRSLLERQIVVVFVQFTNCTIFISFCFLFEARLGVRKYVPGCLLFRFHLPAELHYSNSYNCYLLRTSSSKQGEKRVCTRLVIVDGLKEIVNWNLFHSWTFVTPLSVQLSNCFCIHRTVCLYQYHSEVFSDICVL